MKRQFPIFAGNPMLFEARRQWRRYLLMQLPLPVRITLWSLIAILYLWLVNLSVAYPEGMDSVTSWGMLIFVSLFAPLSMYGSIAGERDKRSWELLCVAPLSNAQIVVGKFLAGLTSLTFLWGLILIPMILGASAPRSYNIYGGFDSSTHDATQATLQALGIGLSFLAWGASWIAIGVFVSCRARRALTALASVLGIMALVNIVLPVLLSPLSNESGMQDIVTCWMPWRVLMHAQRVPFDSSDIIHVPIALSIVIYAIATAVVLTWAVKTVGFADRDLRVLSIPKGHAQR